jgi:hypothetical protein
MGTAVATGVAAGEVDVGVAVTPVSASPGLETAAGEGTGEAAGEAAGEAVATGLAAAVGEVTDGEGVESGEGDEGQRSQVAAQ